METFLHHAAFALAWASFGGLHSLLAADWVKARTEVTFRPFYRLSYNILAGVHLGGILLLEWGGFPNKQTFAWPEAVAWTLHGVQALGWILIVYAVTRYDMSRFIGLEEAAAEMQTRDARRRRPAPAPREQSAVRREPPVEPLRTAGIHAFVRHPLYTGILIVLWSRIFDEFQLATAVWGTLYILIGTYFEERKLLRVYGEDYRQYRAAVPAYFPWRGKAWRGDRA